SPAIRAAGSVPRFASSKRTKVNKATIKSKGIAAKTRLTTNFNTGGLLEIGKVCQAPFLPTHLSSLKPVESHGCARHIESYVGTMLVGDPVRPRFVGQHAGGVSSQESLRAVPWCRPPVDPRKFARW